MGKLKIKESDFEKLEKAVKRAMKICPTLDDYENAGYSEMRYRWDMLWYSKFPTSSLYSYLNDDHIDTALRQITETN